MVHITFDVGQYRCACKSPEFGDIRWDFKVPGVRPYDGIWSHLRCKSDNRLADLGIAATFTSKGDPRTMTQAVRSPSLRRRPRASCTSTCSPARASLSTSNSLIMNRLRCHARCPEPYPKARSFAAKCGGTGNGRAGGGLVGLADCAAREADGQIRDEPKEIPQARQRTAESRLDCGRGRPAEFGGLEHGQFGSDRNRGVTVARRPSTRPELSRLPACGREPSWYPFRWCARQRLRVSVVQSGLPEPLSQDFSGVGESESFFYSLNQRARLLGFQNIFDDLNPASYD